MLTSIQTTRTSAWLLLCLLTCCLPTVIAQEGDPDQQSSNAQTEQADGNQTDTEQPAEDDGKSQDAKSQPAAANDDDPADDDAQPDRPGASIDTGTATDGSQTIIIKGPEPIPDPPLYFSAILRATVNVQAHQITQTVAGTMKVVQGKADRLSLGLQGDGEVISVDGKNLKAWAVRNEGNNRFLDLTPADTAQDLQIKIQIQSIKYNLRKPFPLSLTHVTPGDSIAFDSVINVKSPKELDLQITKAAGFVPLNSNQSTSFQTATGGRLELTLRRTAVPLADVEFANSSLSGTVNDKDNSADFEFTSTVTVHEAFSEVTVLSGNAAMTAVPKSDDFQLKLTSNGDKHEYRLLFPKKGTFDISLKFVAAITGNKEQGQTIDFRVAGGAVVPLTVKGLPADLTFMSHSETVTPQRTDDLWKGFLPATGRARLSWKAARSTNDGKLFFSTTALIDASVGAGLLRQNHTIDYQVLQGQLDVISIELNGPGEILDIQGKNIVGWKIVDDGDQPRLEATLSQPLTGSSQIKVRSQTALGAFPVRVEGLRLAPVGTIRHSGYLRITNAGSVSLEPTDLQGLTQLSPDRFPGEALKARQTFVYRFPAANHAFSVAADRIEPEVSISELLVYGLSETERVISADVELDIRDAPIRDWTIDIPADYSVVSVTGAGVSDYIPSSTVEDARRDLKIIFGKDVQGRQLVNLRLEKNVPAAAGGWSLPPLRYPDAEAVRGAVGVAAAAGFRVAIGETDLLAEKPLSYFPKPSAELQQAFRIREPGWSATMTIEVLERSIQADVFHLYSLSDRTVFGSALINYFVTGAPVSEWKIDVPETAGNIIIDGQDVRTWRRDGDSIIVTLHQPVMGAYTLLVTFEEKPNETNATFQPGQVTPADVQGERGYIQVVSPMQVELETVSIADDLLKLDALELPAEFRLLSTAPALGTWQYTDRPMDLLLKVKWFDVGSMLTQVVEFSEVNSRVSQDGEQVTDVLYYVKTRGQRSLKIQLPDEPVRLWAVSVNGEPVTARQTEEATLIPLPGGTDPNVPVEVRLRLGKPSESETKTNIRLPVVEAPVMKTDWNVIADENHLLVASGGTVAPATEVLRPSGFQWVANNGLWPLVLIGLAACVGVYCCARGRFWYVPGVAALAVAIFLSGKTADTAFAEVGQPEPLHLNLPILAAGEVVEVEVTNTPVWRADLSMVGIGLIAVGVIFTLLCFVEDSPGQRRFFRFLAAILVALGILMQGGGAPWFFGLLAIVLLLLVIGPVWKVVKGTLTGLGRWISERQARRAERRMAATASAASSSASALLLMAFAFGASSVAEAAGPAGFKTADSIVQQWNIERETSRLTASGEVILHGEPGDQFVLLNAPAVLTDFQSDSLQLGRRDLSKLMQGKSRAPTPVAYVMSIPYPEDGEVKSARYTATFEYQVDSLTLANIPVLSGTAAVQKIELRFDEANWDVFGTSTVKIDQSTEDQATKADILLSPGTATIGLKPRARDLSAEETKFFVEGSHVFLPAPGVVDGRHVLSLRTSQGQVDSLTVKVPSGLTVSSVEGPVGGWQFDAESGDLKLQIEPAQSKPFALQIQTQRGLDPLPTNVELAPLQVVSANGEVGLVAVAFGPEVQPDQLQAENLSTVNPGDFNAGMLKGTNAVLHRVFRYGAEGGKLQLSVAPVKSEVRVTSQQVLSLGEERVLMAINFVAEISRAGLFQLSFPLPDGFEVESISGAALHHWSELSNDDGQRQIILHLNGQTLGAQKFSVSLSGATPTQIEEWQVPRFQLNESSRQTGQLVVRPATGLRLRTVNLQNVSEADPRSLGGNARGALAFRLLQRDWDLSLGIEKLDPWVTGQVLHEVTLREGQTRSAIIGNFNVQNASIESMSVTLPLLEDEQKTVRATGASVSDLVRVDPESNEWRIQFKRRVVGKVNFRIEYERRGDGVNDETDLRPASFPEARQLAYYIGVRPGGRLELSHEELPGGWQKIDWNSVPSSLTEADRRTAPVLAFRVATQANRLTVNSQRHSLADSLKLRVARGTLTTVLSSSGDQLTAVEMTMEVIQRSNLAVNLPEGGQLFSIFVNGESVNSIRRDEAGNTWQFYILPGLDDRTADVRFVYSLPGDRLKGLQLTSPELNVPLENIEWQVTAPKGYRLADNDGNLELVGQTQEDSYDRTSYLSKASVNRQAQAKRAAALLQQANQLLQKGEQSKATWALQSVANQYALDAASNEDARVQLQNLQTQQAIVGLNSRRQRLYLDNSVTDSEVRLSEQLKKAAADNPILQDDKLEFRPQQLSQLLQGNTVADNAVLQRIASRLVQHQHATDPAPQAIIISMPEEGDIYTFQRGVQVSENAPLELDLDFAKKSQLETWKVAAVLLLLALLGAAIAVGTRRRLPVSE